MTKTFTFETLTAHQAQALARAHITRFERLLEKGAHIREEECRRYLAIWKHILAKTDAPIAHWKAFCTQAERMEIGDACFSGDYDELLESAGLPPNNEPDWDPFDIEPLVFGGEGKEE